jgi:hypothetical protein
LAIFHIKLLNCHRLDILGANYCKDGHEKKHAQKNKQEHKHLHKYFVDKKQVLPAAKKKTHTLGIAEDRRLTEPPCSRTWCDPGKAIPRNGPCPKWAGWNHGTMAQLLVELTTDLPHIFGKVRQFTAGDSIF